MAKSKTKRMSAAQYQAAVDALGFSHVGAVRFLKIGERTSRRYVAGGASRMPSHCCSIS